MNIWDDGGFEGGLALTSVGTPATSERSNTQAHSGTYSWKVVTDAAGEGISRASDDHERHVLQGDGLGLHHNLRRCHNGGRDQAERCSPEQGIDSSQHLATLGLRVPGDSRHDNAAIYIRLWRDLVSG